MAHVQLFTADAKLVDCQLVRTRKAEFNFFSPAELMQFVGPAVLDESSAHIPLKVLLISRSTVRVSMVENSHDVVNIPPEKSTRKLGGRPRLAVKDQKFSEIGRLVGEEVVKCERGFRLLRRSRSDGIGDLNALRNELSKNRFSAVEIEALLEARTPKGAAKLVVAKKMGLHPATVHSYCSRFRSSKLLSL
jgi:hypothetical protein